MANQGERVGAVYKNLPLHMLIGAPLTSAVDSIKQTAEATANFIKDVGLQEQNGKMVATTVDFSYRDKDDKLQTISAPLLSMVNIPCINLDDVDVKFTAKVNAMSLEVDNKDNKIFAGVEASAGTSKLFSAAANASGRIYTHTQLGSTVKNENTLNTETTYEFRIHAKHEKPTGLDKLLSILENQIRSTEDITSSNDILVFDSATALPDGEITVSNGAVTVVGINLITGNFYICGNKLFKALSNNTAELITSQDNIQIRNIINVVNTSILSLNTYSIDSHGVFIKKSD